MAETATIAHETAKLFPDVPLSRYDVSGTYWQKGAGKPLTMAEKRAIFGDAYMVPSNVTNLKPLRHEPTIRVIASTSVDGKTSEHVAIGACQTAQTAPVQDARPVDPVMESGSYGEEIIVERAAVSRTRKPHGCENCTNYAQPNDTQCAECRAEQARIRESMERVKRSRELDARLTVHAAASVAARVCPSCGTPAEPTDKFCAECGARLAHDATTHEPTLSMKDVVATWSTVHEPASADPAQEHADAIYDAIPADVIRAMRGKYSPKNCARIFAACPHATEVRGFHDWLKIGRAVQKGQKGIKILAPVTRKTDSGESVVNVKPAYVFDVSQTAPIAPKQPRASQPDGTSYAAAD